MQRRLNRPIHIFRYYHGFLKSWNIHQDVSSSPTRPAVRSHKEGGKSAPQNRSLLIRDSSFGSQLKPWRHDIPPSGLFITFHGVKAHCLPWAGEGTPTQITVLPHFAGCCTSPIWRHAILRQPVITPRQSPTRSASGAYSLCCYNRLVELTPGPWCVGKREGEGRRRLHDLEHLHRDPRRHAILAN